MEQKEEESGGFEDARRDREPRNADGFQKLEEAKKRIPSWHLQKEADASADAWL